MIKKLAKEYLSKAYAIFKSIGAEAYAIDALTELSQLEQKEVSIYGGIEIGSKGVKAMVLELSPADKEGFYNVEEKFRRSINTGLITGVKETGAFSEDAIKETAEAVKELFNLIKKKYGVKEENFLL